MSLIEMTRRAVAFAQSKEDAAVDLTKADIESVTEPIAIVKPPRFTRATVLAWLGLGFLGSALLMLLVTYAYALVHPTLTVDLWISTAKQFVTESPILFGVVIGLVIATGIRYIKDLTTLVLTPVYLALAYIVIITFSEISDVILGEGLVSTLVFFWAVVAYYSRSVLLKFAAKSLGLEALKRFNPPMLKAATVTKRYPLTTPDTVISEDVEAFLNRKVESDEQA